MGSGYCIECGTHVPSFDGLRCCPACGSTALPCWDADNVTVSLNWRELHVLCCWAENHALVIGMPKAVYRIAATLEGQHPDRHPLTLARELVELRKEYDATTSDGDLNEQVQRMETEGGPP